MRRSRRTPRSMHLARGNSSPSCDMAITTANIRCMPCGTRMNHCIHCIHCILNKPMDLNTGITSLLSSRLESWIFKCMFLRRNAPTALFSFLIFSQMLRTFSTYVQKQSASFKTHTECIGLDHARPWPLSPYVFLLF